jgi:ribosomal protein S18 acetylase RimI-like enzyme
MRAYSRRTMPGLEIHPFSDDHVEAAAGLLQERHRRHRAAEPLLGDSYDYRAEVEALSRLDDASGAVATRGGRMAGYLLGTRKDDARWGANVWVEPAGQAVEEAEDIRDLYAAAAEQWVADGRMRQYVMTPASDVALLDAWNRLSFGQQHAHGIREIPETPWPENVRTAREDDIDVLVELSPLLVEHQALAPVFGIGLPRESREEIRAEILEDLANPELGDFVAEQDGRIVGAFQLAPARLSSMHAGLASPEGAVLLNWAATRPEVRGAGFGRALTDASFAWAREQGYETMVTDWRMTNLLSSRFWPRRGFRTTFLRLYRSVP